MNDDDKIRRLYAGERVIVDDEWLDRHTTHKIMRDLRTCVNRRRVGIHDQYVAWATDSAVPKDLEYTRDSRYALGSK